MRPRKSSLKFSSSQKRNEPRNQRVEKIQKRKHEILRQKDKRNKRAVDQTEPVPAYGAAKADILEADAVGGYFGADSEGDGEEPAEVR